MKVDREVTECLNAVTDVRREVRISIWHRRFGHPGPGNLQRISKVVTGMYLDPAEKDIKDCETCIVTKMTAMPHRPVPKKTKRPLELIHTDICGPMRTTAMFGGYRYTISFIDDYSRFVVVYLMKQKSEALDMLKKYISTYGKPNELEVNGMRNDNGGEYISGDFRRYCIEKGIHQEHTNPYQPQQNGLAERSWRTLMKIVRSLLKDAGLDDRWWGQAMKMAAYIRNRTLTRGNKDLITPYELFYGEKPDVSNM